MASRSDMDRPAAFLAAVAGAAILLVALPFTIAAFPQTPKSFDANWGERTVDSKTVTVPTDTGTYSVRVAAADFQPASIKVETPACTDTFSSNFQQAAATLHVKLTQTAPGASKVLKEGDFPCPGPSFTVTLGAHADVAGAQATSPATAKKIVWLDAAAMNVTGVFTLEVTPSRPTSQVPALPVTPATSLVASLRVTLDGWDAAMNEHQKEVAK